MAARRHTGRTVALLGGGALAAWLLLRGKGRRVGGGNAEAGAPARGDARAVVWIRSDRLEIDGVVADQATVVARARAVGKAEVHATGGAIEHVVRDVLTALHAADVTLYTAPDLAYIVPSEVVS